MLLIVKRIHLCSDGSAHDHCEVLHNVLVFITEYGKRRMYMLVNTDSEGIFGGKE